GRVRGGSGTVRAGGRGWGGAARQLRMAGGGGARGGRGRGGQRRRGAGQVVAGPGG
ncbi:pseudouridine synthase, partial [Achromobacter ruhlandii]|nr:pseudouridine synthase [Achromobacter ruhlandii]